MRTYLIYTFTHHIYIYICWVYTRVIGVFVTRIYVPTIVKMYM